MSGSLYSDFVISFGTRPTSHWIGRTSTCSILWELSGGLPVGLQLMTSQGQDRVLTEVAHAYQSGTDWHKQLSPGGQ